MTEWPHWLAVLSEEELFFLKRFLLSSGSLKAVASEYGVSYPTIRGKLDRMIAKVEAAERPDSEDAFERLLHILVDEGLMVLGTARSLLQAHKRVLRETRERAERLSHRPPEFGGGV